MTDAWLPFKDRHFSSDQAKYQQATDITKQANQGMISHKDFVDQIGELAGVPPTAVGRAISRNLPNEPLFEYMSGLKEHYKIGLLSNIAGDYLDRMFTPEQRQVFDETSLSFENGYVKPQPQAYRLMAQKLGVEPDECVMVDDQEHQVAGARQVGMAAVLYENFDQFRSELEKLLADPKS